MQRVLFATVTLALLLTACAPAAPTVSPEQVQASAMAAASTMIALTVAAVPTNTPPPPPTDTPLPSPTPMTLPTLANPATPTTASTGGDDCNHLFDVGASGPTTSLQVNNNTKGSISGSVYLGTPNTFAQCGWISFGSIAKGQSASIDIPLVHTSMGDSCYWASAWVNDPKKQTQPNGGPFCIDNTLKWTLNVNYDKITITPP